MTDTSSNVVFVPVIAVHVDTARYLWSRAGICVDLPISVSVAERRSRSAAVTRLNAVVDCSRTWRVERNVRDSLARDPKDTVASTVFERKRGTRMNYDKLLRALDSLIGCFVIICNYLAAADVLRFELARDTHIDLALNILMLNECLSRGGRYWSRTRGNRAPIAQLWTRVSKKTPSLPQLLRLINDHGLLDMYATIEANARATAYVNDTPFNLVRRWHSSLARLRPFELSFNVENIFGLNRPRNDCTSRMIKPLPAQPSYSTPFFFHVGDKSMRRPARDADDKLRPSPFANRRTGSPRRATRR